MYDLPELLAPTKTVSGRSSTVPSRMGPKFSTETVSIVLTSLSG